MDMHIFTRSAPVVLLPNWQGSERRLHKRAPLKLGECASFAAKLCADECTAAELIESTDSVPPKESKESKAFKESKESFVGHQGKHDQTSRISREEAESPIPAREELNEKKMKAKGDPKKLSTPSFNVSGHHPPLLPSWLLTTGLHHAAGEIEAGKSTLILSGFQDPCGSFLSECLGQGREDVQQEEGRRHACSLEPG